MSVKGMQDDTQISWKIARLRDTPFYWNDLERWSSQRRVAQWWLEPTHTPSMKTCDSQCPWWFVWIFVFFCFRSHLIDTVLCSSNLWQFIQVPHVDPQKWTDPRPNQGSAKVHWTTCASGSTPFSWLCGHTKIQGGSYEISMFTPPSIPP